jgi:dTDP-glucose 4,6-dehydratase
MRTILVTGGAGFIGSNFVELMLTKYPDYRIVVYDKLTYAGRLENLARFQGDPRFTFVRGDICDPAGVREVIRAHGVDTLVNFAAEDACGSFNHGSRRVYSHRCVWDICVAPRR